MFIRKLFGKQEHSHVEKELASALQRNNIVALTAISSDKAVELAKRVNPNFNVENLRHETRKQSRLISAKTLSDKNYTSPTIIDNVNCLRDDEHFKDFMNKTMTRNIPTVLIFSSNQSANLYLHTYPNIELVNCCSDLAAA